MREMCIRPIIEDIQSELSDGMRSTVSALEAITREARIPEAPKRSGQSEGTQGSDDKATQGKYYTFWHYELGYREKWFVDEYKAKRWAMVNGWRMD